jgi:hypothetical protein
MILLLHTRCGHQRRRVLRRAQGCGCIVAKGCTIVLLAARIPTRNQFWLSYFSLVRRLTGSDEGRQALSSLPREWCIEVLQVCSGWSVLWAGPHLREPVPLFGSPRHASCAQCVCNMVRTPEATKPEQLIIVLQGILDFLHRDCWFDDLVDVCFLDLGWSSTLYRRDMEGKREGRTEAGCRDVK